jgi:hypothetical protein
MGKCQLAKSLKEKNRWHLWFAIAANAVAFYAVLQAKDIAISGIKSLLTGASSILPVGLAILVTTVINGILSPDAKARVVFLRWHHALPGHRAFTEYAPADPRIDMAKLKRACGNKLPSDPAEQNQTWYRLYKSVAKHPAVDQVHRDFLLMRDYAAFAALCIVVLGPLAFIEAQSWRISLAYLVGLILQFLFVRQAAVTYGMRFVTNVMANK